jgi:hypothetical protein
MIRNIQRKLRIESKKIDFKKMFGNTDINFGKVRWLSQKRGFLIDLVC